MLTRPENMFKKRSFRRTRSTFHLGGLLYILFWGAAILGWIFNIAKIIQFTGVATGELIVRIIGIFVFPIGCIYGWF